jgi:hypothetical protein
MIELAHNWPELARPKGNGQSEAGG